MRDAVTQEISQGLAEYQQTKHQRQEISPYPYLDAPSLEDCQTPAQSDLLININLFATKAGEVFSRSLSRLIIWRKYPDTPYGKRSTRLINTHPYKKDILFPKFVFRFGDQAANLIEQHFLDPLKMRLENHDRVFAKRRNGWEDKAKPLTTEEIKFLFYGYETDIRYFREHSNYDMADYRQNQLDELEKRLAGKKPIKLSDLEKGFLVDGYNDRRNEIIEQIEKAEDSYEEMRNKIGPDSGVLIFQLPLPLAKFWYISEARLKSRAEQDGKDGNRLALPWGDFYQLTIGNIHTLKENFSDRFRLTRINPVGVHDPDRYYYVWLV